MSVPLKLSETILDIWARLLLQVPGSRLRLVGVPEGRARERIAARLGEAGIGEARIEFRPRLAQADFIRAVGELDVVLDTHPFSGATSTLDGLWSGVPVVTLAGERSHSRSTASILQALGRSDWIARTPDEYVRIAARLQAEARDPAFRERLRRDLRASSLCDGPGFARAMERAFREGWEVISRRTERRPGEVTAEFWRGVRVLSLPAVERRALADIADVMDLARPDALERAPAGNREWVLLTHSGAFRRDVAAADVPAALIEAHDALAGLGVSALPCAEPLAAGEGLVRGVELDADEAAGRLYVRAFVPRSPGACVALAGGSLLLRRSHLALAGSLKPVRHSFEWRCAVVRLSHRLHRAGARLGVCVGLAVADRSWNVEGAVRHASLRAVEADLGLPRWGQQAPSARPMKAAVTAAVWASVRPALETLCDSGK